MDPESRLYNELINLIKVSSSRFATKFKLRYDYFDFYDDGIWILGLCMVKWREKGKSFDDNIGFKKYFKTSLFNRFRQLEIKSFCKKSAGVKVPLDFSVVSQVSCDGGFGEVLFKELVDHVSNFLSSREKKVFSLMADPPEDLVRIARIQNSRKMKQSIIHGLYDAHKVRISGPCIHRFLTKNGETISRKELSDTIASIREVVARIVMKKALV